MSLTEDSKNAPQFLLAQLVSSVEAWTPAFQTKSAWQEWAKAGTTSSPFSPAAETAAMLPSVAFLPIAMRKKLSHLSKVALYVMHASLDSVQRATTPIIMASRHGESLTTIELLEAIAKSEPSSPMAFSRSVHNATVGLFSIASQNTTPNTAIAAMENTFAMGLLDALLQLYSDRGYETNLVCLR